MGKLNGKIITVDNWYLNLIADIKILVFEGIVRTKWEIGKRIIQDELKFNKPEYGSKRIENLAKDLRIGAREIWRCIQFAKKCHAVTELEGKSWRWIANCYLPKSYKKEMEYIPLPEGKYNIIYADPPWRQWEGGWKDPIQHYDTLSVEEIKNYKDKSGRKISDLAHDNCILFLWASHPYINDAMEVINAWGFKYSTIGFIWIKSLKDGTGFHFGLGSWTRANTEPCYIATKGTIERKDAGISQIIYEPLREHSRKPDIIRDKIVQLVGDLPRIELFARNNRPPNLYGNNIFDGWDVWGEESKSDINLQIENSIKEIR